ncbi:hypothetical protein Ancab_012710 [Ancistrocladus abbreviatus]
MGRRDDCRFLKIADALSAVNQRVNLIGVVAEYSIPKRSKGTDYFCRLRIVDESHDTRGLSVHFFMETMEKLPQVESCADIILLSNVVIKVHTKEIYALVNKKFSSFALYEGKYGESFTPYQASAKFCPRVQDKTLIADLRKWSDGIQFDIVSGEFVPFTGIKVGERADLICKILYVYEVTEDDLLLFVWDGTDTPPLEIETKLENEKENPIPLQVEPHPLSRNILCKFPTVGTILRVSFKQGSQKFGLPSLGNGKWVRFVNLTFEVDSGLWRGVFTSFTKIRVLPNEDHLILKRQREFEERLSSKWERMPYASFPWPSFITETDCEDVPFVTLMDIITYSQVTAKFKCVVRVVAALPWKAEDFCSPSRTYRIQLTLEDPTARMHAYVYAEDGERLFDGYPSIDELNRKRNKLLGIPESDGGNAPRSPPWVKCCIKSYYVCKDDEWGSRKFRIFGTRLTC